MIGMTDLVVSSTSTMLIEELAQSYSKNDLITAVEKTDCNFTVSFTTNVHNEEKESLFVSVVEKILHLKDPSDKQMDSKIEARYLQQASKEYFFSKGELVRYRGFIDTDNPVPMVSNLIGKLH